MIRSLRRFRYHTVRPWWTTYRFVFLAVVATLTFVLGFFGWGASPRFEGRAQVHRLWDQLFATVQLFGFDAPNPPPNRLLGFARFLIPFTTAWAGLTTLRVIFTDQWLQLRVRRQRRHVVVCGLGRTGTRVALALWEDGHDVVAIEKAAANPSVVELRAQGVPVLVGDATNPVLLRHVGVGRRASRVVVVTGDDGRNGDIALRVAALCDRRSQPLTVVVHVTDSELTGLLHAAALAGDTPPTLRLEFFNVFDIGPRVLLSRHHVLDVVEPHVLVVGLTDTGRAVVREASRRWRHHDASPLAVTIVDVGAREKLDALLRRAPAVEEVCTFSVVDVPDLDTVSLPDGTRSPTTVLICVEPDSRAVAVALALRTQVGSAQVVVCTTERSGFAGLLRGTGASGWPELVGFGILDAACHADVVLGGVNELIARSFHAEYSGMRETLAQELHEGYIADQPGSSSAVPWDELPEGLRESNRRQADDIRHKLALIGCRAVPDPDGTAPLVRLAEAEIERIARAEHDRWWDERRSAGWRLGDVKDVAAKVSPYLKHWDELAHEVKEIDRNFARALPTVLSKSGFAIVRDTEPVAVAPSL